MIRDGDSFPDHGSPITITHHRNVPRDDGLSSQGDAHRRAEGKALKPQPLPWHVERSREELLFAGESHAESSRFSPFSPSPPLPLYAERAARRTSPYDDGGTIVRQADDGREIDARVNLPRVPGRRGHHRPPRAQRDPALRRQRPRHRPSTTVRFGSILDQLRRRRRNADSRRAALRKRGRPARRADETPDVVRLDTDNASYVAGDEAIYCRRHRRARPRPGHGLRRHRRGADADRRRRGCAPASRRNVDDDGLLSGS